MEHEEAQRDKDGPIEKETATLIINGVEKWKKIRTIKNKTCPRTQKNEINKATAKFY